MPTPRRGEVWLIDFGLAGKTQPALIVSVAFGDQDRSLITVVPHTTSLRGSPFEIAVRVSFLKPGAFLVQGVTTFPPFVPATGSVPLTPEPSAKLLHHRGLFQPPKGIIVVLMRAYPDPLEIIPKASGDRPIGAAYGNRPDFSLCLKLK